MLGGGIITGESPYDYPCLGIIVWLALVNTAMAFTLWNYPTNPHRHGINHHQQYNVDPDRHPELDFLRESLSGMEILGMIWLPPEQCWSS